MSGRFYPSDPSTLRATVDKLLGSPSPSPAVALMAPHAGYIYSGSVAGQTYSRLTVPDRAIVLAPNHTGLGRARAALWPSGALETPLGSVPVDSALCESISRRCALVQPD